MICVLEILFFCIGPPPSAYWPQPVSKEFARNPRPPPGQSANQTPVRRLGSALPAIHGGHADGLPLQSGPGPGRALSCKRLVPHGQPSNWQCRLTSASNSAKPTRSVLALLYSTATGRLGSLFFCKPPVLNEQRIHIIVPAKHMPKAHVGTYFRMHARYKRLGTHTHARTRIYGTKPGVPQSSAGS